ncbi:hypothetical protein SESBI_22062 [Sesbania bispinosa]|nr:hypothetical protein SESBI_22062 [Sesbania bispinosa]
MALISLLALVRLRTSLIHRDTTVTFYFDPPRLVPYIVVVCVPLPPLRVVALQPWPTVTRPPLSLTIDILP